MVELVKHHLFAEAHVGTEETGAAEAVAANARNVNRVGLGSRLADLKISRAAQGEVGACLECAIGAACACAAVVGYRPRGANHVCAWNQGAGGQVIGDRRPRETGVIGHDAIDLPAVGGSIHKAVAGMNVG